MLALVVLGESAFASPRAAFDKLKSLQGIWTIESNGKKLSIDATYDVASKNSVVTEYFGKELSVFTIDKERLVMSHFCNIGNQPRLSLKETSNPDVLEFDMFEIGNSKSSELPHVYKVIYDFTKKDRINLELVWKNKGVDESEKYLLSRK